MIRVTVNDLQIIAKIIWNQELNNKELGQFAFESDAISKALDDDKLFKYIKIKKVDKLSSLLYFYVMTRHYLLEAGITNKNISEYVSTLLLEFGDHDRSRKISKVDDDHYDYLYNILEDSKRYDGIRRFKLYQHLGNYSLWVAGMFPQHVLKHGRSLEYFDNMGRHGYTLASVHPMANQLKLNDVFDELANDFSGVRSGINLISTEIIKG